MRRPDRRTAVGAAYLLVATALASVVFGLAGLPSPTLFGGLVGGLLVALTRGHPDSLPPVLVTAAQGVIGVTIGLLVEPRTLRALADDALPIAVVTVATVGVSIASGWLLRLRGTSTVTGAFAMIAGGASGIVAMARDLGADDRVVTVVQYLRVLIVLLVMPGVVALTADGAGEGVGYVTDTASPGVGLVVTAACVVAGVPLARLLRLPSAALFGPMLLAMAWSVSGTGDPVQVAAPVQAVGFAVIGAMVGLRFTRESLRAVARVIPIAVVGIVAVIAVSAGLGLLLAEVTGVSRLDAYLATTPGGLYAVLAAAIASGDDVTFVLAVQVARLLAVLAVAPLLARVLRTR